MRHEICLLRTKIEDSVANLNDIDILRDKSRLFVFLDTAQIQTSSIDLRKSRLIIGRFNFILRAESSQS